jgi:hypothetical protein
MSASDLIDIAKTDKAPDPQSVPEQRDEDLPDDQRLLARLLRGIKRFQMLYRPNGEPDRLPKGSLDSATLAKIKEKHGS